MKKLHIQYRNKTYTVIATTSSGMGLLIGYLCYNRHTATRIIQLAKANNHGLTIESIS